jgi:hypothetical protein
MLQKTLWRMLFYILISYHHVCVMLPQTIVNDERENASLNQCTVGLYQRLGGGGHFVAMSKANSEYSYTFKDNTNGIVHSNALVTRCSTRSISLSNGDIWPL